AGRGAEPADVDVSRQARCPGAQAVANVLVPGSPQRAGQSPAQVLFVPALPHGLGHAPTHGTTQGRLGAATTQALAVGQVDAELQHVAGAEGAEGGNAVAG